MLTAELGVCLRPLRKDNVLKDNVLKDNALEDNRLTISATDSIAVANNKNGDRHAHKFDIEGSFSATRGMR
jgi:hypothetical protein